MAGIGNPDTQRYMAALHLQGYSLGPTGVDGVPGKYYEAARTSFATQNGIDPKDTDKINAALDAKLADPRARDGFLRAVSVEPNPSRSDVVTAQWLLKAGNRDMSKSVDPITGMMDGRRGKDVNDGIAENRRRNPDMAEMRANMSPENFEWARRRVEGLLGRDFKEAMTTPANPLGGPDTSIAKAPENKLDAKPKVDTTLAMKV